jgi:hypothetical protein
MTTQAVTCMNANFGSAHIACGPLHPHSAVSRSILATHEKDRLINEAWEYVLCAIAKMRRKGHRESIGRLELDAYLMRAFQHRLGRLMKRERMHQDLFRVTDPHSLEMLATSDDAETGLFRRLQVQEIVAKMDEWTKEVWSYLSCGKSWEWIARRFGMNKAQAKMRYRYYVGKIRRSLRGEDTKGQRIHSKREKYVA